MTHYRNTIGKNTLQTGGAWLGGANISADLVNVDQRVKPQEPITFKVGLSHNAEYIGTNDPNYRNPSRTSKINWKAGAAGAIAGGAAGAILGPGSAVTAAAGGVAAITAEVLSGVAQNITGGMGYNITYYYRKKGATQWNEMMTSTHSVPSAGAFSNARKEVTVKASNAPFGGGQYEVKIDVETAGGDDVATFTETIQVDKRAKENNKGNNNNGDGFNLGKWMVENPAKAGIGTLFGIVATRSAVESSITGE